MLACILWMKLVSYHHVCWDLREARREARYCWPGSPVSNEFESEPSLNQSRTGSVGSVGGGGSISAAGAEGGEAVRVTGGSRAPHTGGGSSPGPGGVGPGAGAGAVMGVRPGERGCPNSPAEWAVLRYPENLTVADLAYFLAAPTLTYQV